MFDHKQTLYLDTGGWILTVGSLESLLASRCEADTLTAWGTRRFADLGTALASANLAQPLHIVPAHLSLSEWRAVKSN